MNSKGSFIFWIVFWMSLANGNRLPKRHIIMLDPSVHELYKNGGGNIQVVGEIGQFMDITCPQYDEKHSGIEYTYELYKLDLEDIAACNMIEKKIKPIFQCNNPKNSRTLSLKFQLFSPNPYGFTFKTDETYHYLAIPINDTTCKRALRLDVNVKPKKKVKDEGVVKPGLMTVISPTKPTTTTTTQTTTTKKLVMKDTPKRTPSAPAQKQIGTTGGTSGLGTSFFTWIPLLIITCWLQT